MSATVTINLDADVLHLAEEEAKARHTTLSDVIAQQLRVMAQNWQASKALQTPVTDSLRGAVKLPHDFNESAALTEELQEKNGNQG
jgi:predicted transcriptional regulator